MSSDYTESVIAEFRANKGQRRRRAGRHADRPHPPPRRQNASRARQPGRIQLVARRAARDRCVQRRVADTPRLVPQPQGTPDDRRRARHRNVHRAGRRSHRGRTHQTVAPSWSRRHPRWASFKPRQSGKSRYSRSPDAHPEQRFKRRLSPSLPRQMRHDHNFTGAAAPASRGRRIARPIASVICRPATGDRLGDDGRVRHAQGRLLFATQAVASAAGYRTIALATFARRTNPLR